MVQQELREPREFVADPGLFGTPRARCLCTSVPWLLYRQSSTLGLEPHLGLCCPPPPPQGCCDLGKVWLIPTPERCLLPLEVNFTYTLPVMG